MTAIGLGLHQNAIRGIIEKGECQVQAPGLDLTNHNKGSLIIPFHHDLGMITVHGKSRFPALYGWDSQWRRYQPRAPEDHFLINTSRQLEWITGGYIKEFYHEAYFGDDTAAAKQKAIEEKRSLWRVASTFFTHIEGDKILAPLEAFRTP